MAVLILSQVTLKQFFISPELKCNYMCCGPEPGSLCHFLLVNMEAGNMVDLVYQQSAAGNNPRFLDFLT